MDRIQDSGSYDCGSIPHGGTKRTLQITVSFFVWVLLTCWWSVFCLLRFVSLEVVDKNADHTENRDDVAVRDLEIREVLLVFSNECDGVPVVNYPA